MATAIGTFVSFAVTWHRAHLEGRMALTAQGGQRTPGSARKGSPRLAASAKCWTRKRDPPRLFVFLSQRRQGSQGTGRPHERDALCADDDPVCRNGADAFAPDKLPPWLHGWAREGHGMHVGCPPNQVQDHVSVPSARCVCFLPSGVYQFGGIRCSISPRAEGLKRRDFLSVSNRTSTTKVSSGFCFSMFHSTQQRLT